MSQGKGKGGVSLENKDAGRRREERYTDPHTNPHIYPHTLSCTQATQSVLPSGKQ